MHATKPEPRLPRKGGGTSGSKLKRGALNVKRRVSHSQLGGEGDRGRGDVTAILQPKILKEIDFAWVQQVGSVP